MCKRQLYTKLKPHFRQAKKILPSLIYIFILGSLNISAHADENKEFNQKIETDLTIITSSDNSSIENSNVLADTSSLPILPSYNFNTNDNLDSNQNSNQAMIINYSDKQLVDIINERIYKASQALPQNVSQTFEIIKNSLQKGLSSWYGKQFHGRKTANGEKFNMFSYTAAHRTLPFGTLVKVTNPKNNKFAIVRINDRGPYAHSRIIDLSYVAAQDLDIINHGHASVNLEVVKK